MLKHVFLLTAGLIVSSLSYAADKLVIISPHRKSIQEEFIPVFKDYYKKNFNTDIDVEWLDQGGTSDDIRFLRAKYAKTPETSGIDIFWGGGGSTFVELSKDKMLAQWDLTADLKKEIPEKVGGVPLWDKTNTWYATAISSFGIVYNKKIAKMEKLPEPKTWADLGNPVLIGQISQTDPRRSGSASTMNTIILESMGWDKGWELLAAIAGNTRQFTHSSSDPIKAIDSGDAYAATAIDFYALAKVGDIGPENLGFVLPEGQTILDPDPAAILKGAPNRKQAERFMEFVLKPEAQALLMLPKGVQGGPKMAALGRMAINTKAYDITEGKRTYAMNPFKAKPFMNMDLEKAAMIKRTFDDLMGATLIDVHGELKQAWSALVKSGAKPEALQAFAKPPVSEKEFLELAKKWDDNVLRNETINKWVNYSREKFKRIASGT